jgi:hypothetical protein
MAKSGRDQLNPDFEKEMLQGEFWGIERPASSL